MPGMRRLIIAGLVSFFAGLVILFPARVAVNFVDLPGVAIAGVSGSVWRGTARDVSASGVYVRDLSWRLRPFSLFTGRIAATIEARPAGGFVDAGIAISTSGTINITDARLSIPLSLLRQATGIAGLDGMANATFERLTLADGMPVAADGSVEVANLLLPLVSRSPIGGYRAELFSREDGIAGSVEDTDGLIDLAGSFELGTSRTYTFLGQVAPKPDTPAKITQQMRFLGSANERGQYELRLEGQL